MSRLIVENGTVFTGGASPTVLRDGAVVFEGDRILAVGLRKLLVREFTELQSLDARGGLIMPGLINLHHHFYSQLATGLDPGQMIHDFAECLDRFWWRLDRAHNPLTVRQSAQLAALDCIRHGCTTVFDHHASPSCIEGSLDGIAGVMDQAGLSAVLCYEVTDRNGHSGALAGIEENRRFFESRKDHKRVRGMLGFHASFTLSDRTLSRAQQIATPEMGCHIHVAEDVLDSGETRRRNGVPIMTRLHRYGLLGPLTILAHGIHLEEPERKLAAQNGAVLVYNPESNANNAVGRLDLERARQDGLHIAMGTDGMTSSILATLRAGFLMRRAAGGLPEAGYQILPELIETNARVARRFFEEPSLGVLTAGAPADLAVVDYVPVTPIHPGNVFGHLVFGAALRNVRHTIARGRILMQDFSIKTLDDGKICQEVLSTVEGFWDRFKQLESGTPFLGTN